MRYKVWTSCIEWRYAIVEAESKKEAMSAVRDGTVETVNSHFDDYSIAYAEELS